MFKNFLLFLIGVYRAVFFLLAKVSPGWLPGECKFYPSCSRYSEAAIKKYGASRGFWLTGRRLIRCHPWQRGGIDLV